MKKANGLILLFLGCLISALCLGQGTQQHCSAAFLGNRMVVDTYSPAGKCRVSATATGDLTVCTVSLSPTSSKAVETIPFKIAIRDKAIQTLLLFFGGDVRRVAIQRVLAKCKKGDHIVLLTLNDQYALPHNEILVQ